MAEPLVTMIRDLQRRRGRERRGLAIAEGVRLVEEVLAAGLPIRGAAVSPALEATSRGQALKVRLAERGAPLTELTDRDLSELADTEHPQGVIAVITPPTWSLEKLDPGSNGVVLVLDGIQDPGNVGTLIRTAHGLGAAGIIALKGTADVNNPKVLRGAMGSSFRLPVVAAEDAALEAWLSRHRAALWAAAMDGSPLASWKPTGAVALAVGNEGAGLRPELLARAAGRVGIPLRQEAESLNVAVAAGILLFEVLHGR
ncbi:MAG TPA: RNA methyltransferase [Gemmatimonadales bacterium]|nr:RNA methyltransferase [Gemmatimonadales bacterium]